MQLTTNGEVAAFVKNHLLTQGARADAISGHCLYRTPDGRSCAVGCLISDEHYRPNLEGKDVDDMLVRNAVTASLGFRPDFEKLARFQKIHDQYLPHIWPDLLK